MNRPIYVCTEHLTLTLSRQREVRKWRIPTLAHWSRPVEYHIDGPSEWSGSLTAPTILYLMHLTFSTEISWVNVVGRLWLVPWTITEVRQHFLIRTILNTDSITTNTIISSRIISNHRYNRTQARILISTLKGLKIDQSSLYLIFNPVSEYPKVSGFNTHAKPHNGNANRLAKQQQPNK